MQSRISVSLAQCSGDPGEAPPIFRPRDRPLPYLRVWMPASSSPPPPPLPLSQGLDTALKWKFGGEIVSVSP